MELNKKELSVLLVLYIASKPLYGLDIIALTKLFRPVAWGTVYIRLSALIDAQFIYRLDDGCRPTFEIVEDGRLYIQSLFK